MPHLPVICHLGVCCLSIMYQSLTYHRFIIYHLAIIVHHLSSVTMCLSQPISRVCSQPLHPR